MVPDTDISESRGAEESAKGSISDFGHLRAVGDAALVVAICRRGRKWNEGSRGKT